jgi:hypothetical protein
MRLTTPLFVVANVLLTAHANDVHWRLPLEAGANAAHAVAARGAAARAVESLVSGVTHSQKLCHCICCNAHTVHP